MHIILSFRLELSKEERKKVLIHYENAIAEGNLLFPYSWEGSTRGPFSSSAIVGGGS